MKNIYNFSIYLVLGILFLSGCELNIESPFIFDERNKFVGKYEVEEYSENTSLTLIYDIRIQKSRYPDNIILISNFYDADIEVIGEVNEDRFSIPPQRVGFREIEGRGTWFGGGEISMIFTVREIEIGPDFVDFLSCSTWQYY